MHSTIVIGKHTLESLTSGMYAEPFVIYREYIQNCVDSIDNAVLSKQINKGEEKIEIELFPSENKIIIEDNGSGISAEKAENVLLSIGNSPKTSMTARGFRGIGRLSALSYCKRLTFITSFSGEQLATEISLDAETLSVLLADYSSVDVSIEDVLNEIVLVKRKKEEKNKHYFRVIIEGVDTQTELLSTEKVLDYLSQNMPVPFSPRFSWGQEITNRIKKEGYAIPVYNIVIRCGAMRRVIFKPYENEFLADKGKKLYDSIKDIEILPFTSSNNRIIAVGWVGKTNYYGSIYDKAVKGIRLRQGNIQIGDQQTMNSIFKDPRFNGWSIGEFYIIDRALVPNARRDNFEKNEAYFCLFEQFKAVATVETKRIRAESLKRNKELKKAITEVEKNSKKAAKALKGGVSTYNKRILENDLLSSQELLSVVKPLSDSDEISQEIAFEQLDLLIGRIKGATAYKALNSIDSLSLTEKRILERVFNIINTSGVCEPNKVIDAILNDYAKP